ncbi:MAG: Uma2 family endonuclease, partial [Microcystis sp.]
NNPEAIAAQQPQIPNQQRLAKQDAEQKSIRLAERLRALGINPDEM